MSSALDMSLDEIIKNNKKSSSGAGRSRSGSGGGPLRRVPNNRAVRRSAPYPTAKAPDSAWQHDKFSDQLAPAARPASIETGTKLYISNLDYGVSNEDIKELFAEIGDLKRYSIHYDRSGRSKGTAEVVFARRIDAVAAVKRYNNVQLDGKPMKIEIIEKVLPEPPAPKAGVRNVNSASKKLVSSYIKLDLRYLELFEYHKLELRYLEVLEDSILSLIMLLKHSALLYSCPLSRYKL